MSSRYMDNCDYMDNYNSDPNMQGDGPPMLVLGHVQKTGGATNRIIFDSTDHPDHARCQQLAALEAEIGRAVIGKTILQKMAVDMAWDGEMDAARLTGDQSDKYHDELPQLIARWRELHAEGAEGGKG